jgi:hypothetical protein
MQRSNIDPSNMDTEQHSYIENTRPPRKAYPFQGLITLENRFNNRPKQIYPPRMGDRDGLASLHPKQFFYYSYLAYTWGFPIRMCGIRRLDVNLKPGCREQIFAKGGRAVGAWI